jgi:hypothetical protein
MPGVEDMVTTSAVDTDDTATDTAATGDTIEDDF